MLKSISHRRPLLSLLACYSLAVGCGSKYSTSATIESQTLIGIEPHDFVAPGACGTRLLSYVASLYDDTGAVGLLDAGVSTTSFFVASTPPKDCSESTVFSDVVSEHAYRVELQGYAQSAMELVPATAGSSAMLLSSDQSYITPAWTAACHGWTDSAGNPQPGYAYSYVTMKLTDCSQLGSEP